MMRAKFLFLLQKLENLLKPHLINEWDVHLLTTVGEGYKAVVFCLCFIEPLFKNYYRCQLGCRS